MTKDAEYTAFEDFFRNSIADEIETFALTGLRSNQYALNDLAAMTRGMLQAADIVRGKR